MNEWLTDEARSNLTSLHRYKGTVGVEDGAVE